MISSNLIITKYTQGGEFIRADNYADYKGYYYELKGKNYIGKEYNISAIELLKPGTNQVNTLINNPSTAVYGVVSGQNIQQVNIVSIPFAATQEDINRGYATRYFVKKANETLIKETNQATYNQIKNDPLYQSVEVQYDLQVGFRDYSSQETQLPGISAFIKGQERVVSSEGEGLEFHNQVKNDLPPTSQTPAFDSANDKGRKAEAPNISTISDSDVTYIEGPFYGNGKKKYDKMAVVDGGVVAIDVVKPLLLMKKFAKDDKVTLTMSSGFRPAYNPPIDKRSLPSKEHPKGVDVWANSQENLRALYLAKKGNKAAPAGTSNHGNAFAFDLSVGSNNYDNKRAKHPVDKKTYQWLIDYAWIFGFIRAVPSEEWHWEYLPGQYQFSICNKSPNGNKEPWWDGMRLDPTPETEKRVAEIKAALGGNVVQPPSPISTTSQYNAILVGGLDNRTGDKTIDQQVALLKKGIGEDKKVKGFRYNTSTTEIINFLKQNPKTAVFTFSAGCNKAYDLSLDKTIIDVQKFFIIEPYASSSNTKTIVNNAVTKNGIPAQNVYVDTSEGRGGGIVVGASSSDSKEAGQSYMEQHFNSLATVGAKVKNATNAPTPTTAPDPQKVLEDRGIVRRG
jgi:LAS superfamily LD-carboxypeptidase LdcB